MNTLLVTAVVSLSLYSYANEPKVDWALCEKEVASSCSGKKDDHATHECLEKLPKGKVSKECGDFNHKLDAKFKDKHGEHKH